jgi:hypothetical protein
MMMMMGGGEIVYSSLSRQSEGGIDLPPPRIRTAAFKDSTWMASGITDVR